MKVQLNTMRYMGSQQMAFEFHCNSYEYGADTGTLVLQRPVVRSGKKQRGRAREVLEQVFTVVAGDDFIAFPCADGCKFHPDESLRYALR